MAGAGAGVEWQVQMWHGMAMRAGVGVEWGGDIVVHGTVASSYVAWRVRVQSGMVTSYAVR